MKKFLPLLLSFSLFYSQISIAVAQTKEIIPSLITPDHSNNTQVISAPNGITIVNIADPSNNGTSINNFDKFNVSESGAILNNSNVIVNTELAGFINGNNNITNGSNKPASVIVGEVTSLTPSNLLGFTEIAGNKAEFILLNPNGISCNGCGFINMGNVTLATGKGDYSVNKDLLGIAIGAGSISFIGKGANASLTETFKIISKYIEIDSKITAGKSLEMHAGNGKFNTTTNKFTNTEENNESSSVNGSGIGIDASALGSMYAGQVSLNASSAGLGVNIASEVMASSGGININANGDLTYINNLTATGDIDLKGNNINGNGEINGWENTRITAEGNFTNSKDIKANKDITITSKGNFLNNNLIGANGNLYLLAQNSFINSGNLSSGGNLEFLGINFTNNGSIFSKKETQITGTNFIHNNSTIEAGSNLSLISSGNIINQNLSSLGSLKITGENLINHGNLLGKENIEITASKETQNNGIISSNGSIELSSEGNIINNNNISSGKNLIISGNDITNIGTIFSQQDFKLQSMGFLLNDGTIESEGNMILLACGNITNNKNITSLLNLAMIGQNLTNNGNISGRINVNISGENFIENNSIISSNETLEIKTDGKITNKEKITSNGNLLISGDTLLNNGIIFGGKTVKITGKNNIKNNSTIASNTTLELFSDGKITNHKEIISMGNLNIAGYTNQSTSLLENITLSSTLGATIRAKGKLNIFANQINNIGKDIWGSDSGYIITTEKPNYGNSWLNRPKTCTSLGYGSYLCNFQVAVSTLTTLNSSITSGSNMEITGNVLNHGGDILSGGNLLITGNVENKVTSFQVTGLVQNWVNKYEDCAWHSGITNSCSDEYSYYTALTNQTLFSNTASKIGASGNLTITGNKITNSAGLASFNSNASFAGVNNNLNLQTSITSVPEMEVNSVLNSGLFTLNENGKPQIITGLNGSVSFTYFLENNVNFTNVNNFLTSSYFLSAINFYPEKDIILLGSAEAEKELIINSLANLGMTSFLNGDDNNLNALYENGASWFNTNKETLNLSFGVALTTNQIANLTSNIVLPVFQVINGVSVLVPQVYLSQNTLASLNNKPSTGGTIFAGGDMFLSGNEGIINSGGITSVGSLIINTNGTFANIGGNIDVGENFTVSANNILFDALTETSDITQTTTYKPPFGFGGNNNGLFGGKPQDPIITTTVVGKQTNIHSLSNITVGGNMNLDSSTNITTNGALINTAGNTSLTAEQDILLGAASSSSNIALSWGNGNMSSAITNANATHLTSGGDILINAGGDFSLIAGISGDSYYYHNKEDGGLFGKDKEETFQSSSSTLVSGSITGNNVTINAGKESNIEKEGTEGSNGSKESTGDINIFASNITGKEDITLTSDKGNVNILAGIETESSASQSLSSGLLSGKIEIDQKYKETVSSSNIIAGNGLTITSGKDVNILASNLAGKDGEINANGNLNILSLETLETLYHFEKETSVDLTAVAIAAAAAATGVGAVAGLAALATITSVSIGLGAVGVGALGGAALGSQVHNGEINKDTTIITNNVSSNLNFTNSLTLNTESDINLNASNITAESVEINLNGENSELNLSSETNLHTTIHEYEKIKPNYTSIALSAALVEGITASKGPLAQGIATALGVGAASNPDDQKPTNSTADIINTIISLIPSSNKPTISLPTTLPPTFPDLYPPSKPSGTGVTVHGQSPLKPPVYTKPNGVGFTLMSNDERDPSAPLKPNGFHNHYKPEAVVTTNTETVNASINTNNLIINKK
jgi:filamentous hemagglutinin